MATNQYIGARYVPVFADPAEWNNTRTYEPLTIVMHNGNSYTSAQYVPKGIDISNEEFWKLTGNYNAQVEQYRKELVEQIAADKTAMNTLQTNVNKQIDALSAETQQIETNKINIASLSDTKANKKKYMLLFGDSWTDPNRSAEGAGTKWYVYVCKELQLEPLNYAVWGNQFGSNFNDQLTKAKSGISDSVKADITDVVIFGGVNNLTAGETGASLAGLVRDFVASVYAWIPTARITVVTPNYPKIGSDYMTLNHAKEGFNYTLLLPIYMNTPCNIVNSIYWTFGYDAYTSDNIHPNEFGNKLIAERMLQALRGGDCEKVTSCFNYKVMEDGVIPASAFNSNCPGVDLKLEGATLTSSSYLTYNIAWFNENLMIRGNMQNFTDISGHRATVKLNIGKIKPTKCQIKLVSSVCGLSFSEAFDANGDYVYTMNFFMLEGSSVAFDAGNIALMYIDITL